MGYSGKPMPARRPLIALILSVLPCLGATFGTVVQHATPLADLALDEARKRLYVVNTAANQVEVYNTATNPPQNTGKISTDQTPLSIAISRSGKYLYVACYDAASIDVIDLDRLQVARRVTLAAKPEGVAVGFDEKVLVSTIGTGQGQAVLTVYDPNADVSRSLQAVVIAPPAPTPPQLPPPSGRIFLASRSRLLASADGRLIVGMNQTSNTAGTLFIYDAASSIVLRSRSVTNVSPVLSMAPDASEFMAGSTLFDLNTLQVIAQQNASNAPFSFPTGNTANFNLQQNQGGSVFAPDGSRIYSAFNIAPVQNPAAPANVSRLLVNDPDNLLIRMGLQLPQNLSGKMVITGDGGTIYAIAESGFMVLPVGSVNQFPIAAPGSAVALLASDQCGVNASQSAATVAIRNVGGGPRMTATVQLLNSPNAGPIGLGGIGGPGGGGPGGGIIIVLPPTVPGGGGVTLPGIPVTGGGTTTQANGSTQTAPLVGVGQTGNGADLKLQFNPVAGRSVGTVTPHDLLLQSAEAINIPPNVRVFQNFRNAEARGAVLPVDVGVSNSEGLVDMVADTTRQRLYIANSGLNRVEVFDMAQQRFLAPIKVGQLPRSLAFGSDGSTLYVANTGGESVSIVDLDRGVAVGRVKFPPIPFNAAFSLITPSVIASTQRGPQVIMSDGTLWKIVGDTAVPRTLNPSVFGSVRTITGPVRTMSASPEGRFLLLLAGNGSAYLYSSDVDDFVTSRQVVSAPIQGYFGPVAAGPNGQYYVVNNLLLDQALTAVGANAAIPGIPTPGGGGLPDIGAVGVASGSRPVAAVAAAGARTFARFSMPVRANTAALPADAGQLELVDVDTQRVLGSAAALEGPLAAAVGTQRVNVSGRTMALDAAGATAYVLTTTGLSIVTVDRSLPADRPQVNPGGVVNNANYQAALAPGGLVSVFGRNLGADGVGSERAPLPALLGGSCVTLNNAALPLLAVTGGQINAQIPPTLAPGRYPLVVRSADKKAASPSVQVTVAKYAPAVFVDSQGPAIFHQDGRRVDRDHPAQRDEPLTIYATGLGLTKGGKVTAGAPSPSNPLAVTEKVQVFFGNPGIKEAEVIVDWSGLTPGSIGLYQINGRVPGAHLKGSALPVLLRIGGVNSPVTGSTAPTVSVD